MEMVVDYSVPVSNLTRKICNKFTAAKFRRHQCALLQIRCVQVDGYVLAWRSGPFREELVASFAMAELVKILQRALWILDEAASDRWLQHALARHYGENEISGVIDDLNLCVELVVNRVSCHRMDSVRRKVLEDAAFVKFALIDAASRDRDDLLQELRNISRSLIHPQVAVADFLLNKLNKGECRALKIDDFEKRRVVGSGASGKVFEASWFGHPVAVKCFRNYDLTYEREKEAMCKLVHPHPNILQMLGYSDTAEGSFIVMELMKMDLRKFMDRWKDGHLPLLVAVDIMLQIARGTRYLHDNNIVHRDLKPHNVLVDFDDGDDLEELFPGAVSIRLTDFGISKMEFHTHVAAQDLTDMRGTMRYMAPEIMAKNSYSRKVDVYSFAVTCSEILTKNVPFGIDMIGVRDLKGMIEAGSRPPLPEDCPWQLKELIQNCWKTNPDDRPSFVDIEENLTSLKRSLLEGQNICASGMCSSCSNSLSTTSSNSLMVPPSRTPTLTDRRPKLTGFRFSRTSHDIGGKVSVHFKFADGAKWAVCRWKREPRSGPAEFITDPFTVSEVTGFKSLSYTVTAFDYDKKVSLECLPMNELMNTGNLLINYIKGGDYVGLGNHLEDTIERSWRNGQARFQVQHLHHRWWESGGKLIINHEDFLLWWGQSNTKNLRNKFGPEHEDGPVELDVHDGALFCTLKGNDGSRHKVKFPDSASRDTAVLTLKFFWDRHRQSGMSGR